MLVEGRHRTDPVAAHAYTVPVVRRPSQRDLVAWSLLRCPDDSPPWERR